MNTLQPPERIGLSWILLLVCAMFFVRAQSSRAQEASHPTDVLYPVYHDTSLPLSVLVQAQPAIEPTLGPIREIPNHEFPYESTPLREIVDRSLQNYLGSGEAVATISNFDAISNLCSCYPPDPNSAAGLNHVFHTVNTHFAIYDKQGVQVQAPALLAVLFTGVPGGTRSDGDPVVLYDRTVNRWVVMQFSVANPYYILFAVSTSSDPLGTYNRYSYQFTAFPDYPHISVWRDGYYIGMASFSGGTTYIGDMAAVVERDSMLVGGAARLVTFQRSTSDPRFLPSDADGALPPPGTPNYFTGVSLTNQRLQVYEFAVNWANPATSTFTGPLLLPTDPFVAPVCASRNCLPQPGTAVGLDHISDRLLFRVQYRNFGGYQTMVANHTVKIGAAVQAGIRWYELRKSGGPWSIYQQGTYAPDSSSRWMASIAMDKYGNIGLGYTITSSTIMPSIRFTGRRPGDPLGVMTIAETTIVAGTGVQTGTAYRWGDYSSMQLDPTDDWTFWYTHEYIPTTSTAGWRTRIASFRLPPSTNSYVKGTITNVSGGAPVANANVDFVESITQVPGISQANGFFVTGARLDSPATSANLTLRARKFGFRDTTLAVTVTLNDTLTRNFAMTPLPSGTLTVRTLRTDSVNVRSAITVLLGTTTVASGFTDSTTGLYSVVLPTGSYDVIADPPNPLGTRRFNGVSVGTGTTFLYVVVRRVVENSPAALRDTLAVSQSHAKTLQLTNTTADSVPWRLSADEALAIANTPADLKAIARSKEQQPSYDLPKGAVDPRSEPAGLNGRGGPDAFGYVWIDSDEPGGPTFNWIDIRPNATRLLMTDDNNQGPFPLGFTFPFYGNNFTSLRVCSNGWLSFTSTSTALTNVAIPATAEPNNALYGFWDDLNPNATGRRDTIYYYADAANNRFIVQYQNVRRFSDPTVSEVTFQVILKADGSILCQYQTMVGVLNSATIGIENGTGTVALQVVFNATYVHDNMALLFKLRGLSWLNFSPTTGILPPSSIQNITATFDATGLTAGTTYNGNTFLDVTHPDVQGTITIPSSLRVQNAVGKVISVTPSSLTFPGTPIGSQRRDSVRVRSIGDQTVTISSVTTTNPRYVATATSTVLAPGDSARIRVTYTPALPAGTDTGRVVILSDATTPRVDVMLTGTALVQGAIVVTPDSFYFSLPQVPDTTRATLKIKNPGTDTLRYNINETLAAFDRLEPQPIVVHEPYDLPKGAFDPHPSFQSPQGAGGPDGFGYRWIDSDEPGGPVFSWVDISGSAPFLDSASAWIITGTNRPGDEGYFPVPLPFSFSFYGVSKDTLFIGTNGNVMFQRPTGDIFTNAQFPTPGGFIDNHIGIFWDDLEVRAGARVYYGTSSGSFVVQYQGMARFAGTVPNYTFEIILSPGGLIKMQYLAMGINAGILNSASIGIENNNGSIGLQTVFNAAYMHNNLAIIYSSDLLPWISTDRTSGTIAPGDSQNVQVKVVPNQPVGGYTGRLRVTGNTPDVKNVGVRMDVTGPPGAGWVANTSGVSSLLYATKAVSLNVGWAAGAGGVVRRTTNGGASWTSAGGGAIGANDIYAIDALDANTAFVTTTPGATFIYKTTNGGATWTQVYTDASTGAFIDGIKMYDANNGIAMGDPVGGKWVILRTSNGGSSWARIATEPNQVGTEAGSNHALWTIGTTHIWFPANGTASAVYRSTDGGATWAFTNLPFTAPFTEAIAFINTQVGFVASSGGLAARTSDGGVTWTSSTFPGSGSLYGAAVNGTDFFATRGTTIWRSVDLGVTWSQSYIGSGTYFDINFVSQAGYGRGWAVSDNGNITAGYFATVGVEEDQNRETPLAFALMQNYPNPFNPSTTIRYALPEDAFVTLKIYNVLGQEVVQLRNEIQNVGNHDVVWDGRNRSGSQVSSGIYFYRIEAKPVSGSSFTSIKKMILLK